VLFGGAHLRPPNVAKLSEPVEIVGKKTKNKNPVAKDRRHELCDRFYSHPDYQSALKKPISAGWYTTLFDKLS